MICTICKEELNTEEIDSPHKNKNGDIICDQCFKDKYTYLCPLCENNFDEDFTKKISPTYLLISDYASEWVGVDSGIYEIVAYPFFYDRMTTLDIIPKAVNLIADLPDDFNEDDFFFELFYVCNDCVEKQLSNGENT